MGVGLLEMGIIMRKGVIFTIRGCFRSVCNHPFLVGFLCFLIFLHRSSPFIFSLLVSSSPILICTAILLGALLSLGPPNIPEIEIEEKTTHEAVSIKTGFSKDTIVEQNESYFVERYSEERGIESEPLTKETSLSADNAGPPIEGISGKINGENWEKANGELRDTVSKKQTEWNDERLSDDGEVMENHYLQILKANVEHEHIQEYCEKSDVDSFDSERVNVASLGSPPRSPWKRVEDRENDDGDDDDDDGGGGGGGDLDSGSDGAESSSPDASMADIMPMLDELHPLLDEDGPQPVQISCEEEESDQESSVSSESVDEIGNQEDSKAPEDDENEDEDEDDDDDDDDDDEAQEEEEDKEEQTKAAIVWTEEDQKNLMDLGSSEIERNQRLENLILRIRTRKNMSMVPEIDLIDLESSDFTFHIPPISTSRQNPFDFPHDSYDNNPIPGSAPSILRKNPFDIPYESSEEKHNEIRDGFREGLPALQSREPFFRRHESFNVGPSIFGPVRQDIKFRPYFVPERTVVPEESSYSPFDQQSSEMSESKVSSVPETESLGSVEDLDERKLLEDDDNPQEPGVISGVEEVTEEYLSRDQELVSKSEFSDVEVEEEVMHVGHGSESSGEEESLELEAEKRDIEFDEIKSQPHAVEDHYEEEGSATQSSEAVEQRHSRGSSSSSLSEVSEEPGVSTTLVEDVPHKEPVYDSSPPAVRKSLSSSSIFSDINAESDGGLPPVLIKRTVSSVEKESESQEIAKEIPSSVEISSEPLMLHPTDENGSARVAQEHDHANTEALAEENIMDKHKSSDDKDLGQLDEEKLFLIPERDNVVREPPFEGQVEAEHSIDKGETVISPTSDGDYQEANEKLVFTTPSAGESSSHFYDIKMHEPDFEHVDEVQVPNTPVESFEKVRSIQNLNIPEIYELDHDTSPNSNSPYSPDFISMPSSASDEASSHVNMETILEEADEIKEIDEVDNIEEIDIHEDDKEHISEPQTSQTSIGDVQVDTSNRELNERDCLSSTDHIITSDEGEIISKENEANSVLNHGYEDIISGTPHLDIQSIEDVDSSFRKDELASVETDQVMVGSANVARQSVIEETIGDETSILEVRSIDDATLDYNNQANGDGEGIHRIPDSGETQETSELHVGETIPSEGTSSPSKKLLDGNSEKEKATQETHSTASTKGKGKHSKSSSSRSSSSSSSSSESSSSDSD